MISGIDLSETMDFVSQFDKNEVKTVFKISPVSSRIQARIGRLIGANGEGAIDAMIEAFRFGVKGIINLKDSKGNILQFKQEKTDINSIAYQVVSEEIIGILPMKILSEVGSKIMTISNLSEEEAKN